MTARLSRKHRRCDDRVGSWSNAAKLQRSMMFRELRYSQLDKRGHPLYNDIEICEYGHDSRRIEMRQLVQALKAVSDPTRLRMIKLLQVRELCVCQLMQALDMRQSRVSRHLAILREAGLVSDSRDGQWVTYSLDHESFNDYSIPVLEFLAGVAEDEKTTLRDRAALTKAARVGPNTCTGRTATGVANRVKALARG